MAHCVYAIGRRDPAAGSTDIFSTCFHHAIAQDYVRMVSRKDVVMEVLTYSDARANLKAVMDRVVRDRTHVVVTRQKAPGAVVIVSLEDWNAMVETMHLLSTPKNADRLRDSIRQLEQGNGMDRQLDTP